VVATSVALPSQRLASRAAGQKPAANQAARGRAGGGRQEDCLWAGPLKLDLAGFAASVDGRYLPLTRAEFLLLAELVRRPYSTLSRERLVATLHGEQPSPAEPLISPRSMDVHIARLRAKLRSAGVDCIKTMRFVGYRCVPAVRAPTDQAGRC